MEPHFLRSFIQTDGMKNALQGKQGKKNLYLPAFIATEGAFVTKAAAPPAAPPPPLDATIRLPTNLKTPGLT